MYVCIPRHRTCSLGPPPPPPTPHVGKGEGAVSVEERERAWPTSLIYRLVPAPPRLIPINIPIDAGSKSLEGNCISYAASGSSKSGEPSFPQASLATGESDTARCTSRLRDDRPLPANDRGRRQVPAPEIGWFREGKGVFHI